MRFKKRLLSLFLVITLLLTGCRNFSIPTNANTAFQNFTLNFFKEEVSSNTINLHYTLKHPEKYGITDIPISLGNFSFDQTASYAYIENLSAALHKFSYKTLSKENQITYDILDCYLNSLKTGLSYYYYTEPLSPVTGIHAQLPVLLAEYQFDSINDVENYLALLETLPDYFSSLVQFEKEKSALGLFMSDAVADEVIAQCNAFISMGDKNYLLSTFQERVAQLDCLTDSERSRFVEKNKEVLSSFVIPAYDFLSSELSLLIGSGTNTQGLCYLEKGSEYYTYLVSSETGSDRTIPELQTLIQNQIVTDLLDCPDVFQETTYSAESPNSILNSLKANTSHAFPSSSSVNVKVKYVPSALEEYLSPAFYLIPAIDNFNDNTIYINNKYSFTGIDLFTTLAHEGYPGHLYQTTYFASTNPDPVRSIMDFPGYVEGWATYAEMCSYYISPLDKPYATLLQKNSSLILGLYALADIGIHYEGWSLDDTILHFSAYGIDDENTIKEIYEYILGDPANYLKYYVGYLEILELKKDYLALKGNDFSQKEFHQELLEIGPAPFAIIRKYML